MRSPPTQAGSRSSLGNVCMGTRRIGLCSARPNRPSNKVGTGRKRDREPVGGDVGAQRAAVGRGARRAQVRRNPSGGEEAGPGGDGAQELGEGGTVRGHHVEGHEGGGGRLGGHDPGLVGSIEGDRTDGGMTRGGSAAAVPAVSPAPATPARAPATPKPVRARNWRRSKLTRWTPRPAGRRAPAASTSSTAPMAPLTCWRWARGTRVDRYPLPVRLGIAEGGVESIQLGGRPRVRSGARVARSGARMVSSSGSRRRPPPPTPCRSRCRSRPRRSARRATRPPGSRASAGAARWP